MEYQDVVSRLAPCGLDCHRCADYERGEIKMLSVRLLEVLGSYQRLAKMKAARQSEFEHYEHFNSVLRLFAEASCTGCRGDHDVCPLDCTAKSCHKEQGIDFCFQCREYPCEKQFEGRLRERWRMINDRLKEIGPVAYYAEQSKMPRY